MNNRTNSKAYWLLHAIYDHLIRKHDLPPHTLDDYAETVHYTLPFYADNEEQTNLLKQSIPIQMRVAQRVLISHKQVTVIEMLAKKLRVKEQTSLT